jgi:hypothetical protein
MLQQEQQLAPPVQRAPTSKQRLTLLHQQHTEWLARFAQQEVTQAHLGPGNCRAAAVQQDTTPQQPT